MQVGDILYCIKTIINVGEVCFKKGRRYEILGVNKYKPTDIAVMLPHDHNPSRRHYTHFSLNKDSTHYQFFVNDYFIPNIERRKQILDDYKKR